MLAEVDAVSPLGPESIAVSGATVSTVQVRTASVASVLPAASVARTRKLCSPCARPLRARGEVQRLPGAVVELALERRAGLATRSRCSPSVDAVGPLGPESIAVSGACLVERRAAGGA